MVKRDKVSRIRHAILGAVGVPPIIGSFFPSRGEDRLVVAPDETPALLVET